MSEVDKRLVQYLTELAVTNPQQLPLAVLEIVKQSLMVAMANQIRETMEAYFSQFEKQLRKELDISSDEKTLGKDIGNDIRNGKKTMIAVYSLQNATGENRQLLNKTFGNRNALDDDIKRVFSLFKEIGSMEYAKNNAIKYNKKAKNALEILRDSEFKDILKGLADYSINREK